jgi:cytochrome c biogenesis protein CcmG, thiol:disulfide interchange protein DsbE
MKSLLILLFSGMLCLFAYQEGDQLPENITQTLDINPNKIYVVDFFASWCHSCKKELPQLSKITSTLNADHVKIIGVDVDENTDEGKKFQEELQLTFHTINDPSNTIIKAFEPVGMPAIYIIKNNKVHRVLFGAMDHIDTVILNELKALQ